MRTRTSKKNKKKTDWCEKREKDGGEKRGLLHPALALLNCLILMVGGVVCAGNVFLYVYTPETKIHT